MSGIRIRAERSATVDCRRRAERSAAQRTIVEQSSLCVCLRESGSGSGCPVKMALDLQLLIAEVFAREPLWMVKHKLHPNRCVVEKFWDAVAKKLDTTSKLSFIIIE